MTPEEALRRVTRLIWAGWIGLSACTGLAAGTLAIAIMSARPFTYVLALSFAVCAVAFAISLRTNNVLREFLR